MEFDTLVGEITERLAIEVPGISEVLTPEVVCAIWNFKAEAGEAWQACVVLKTKPLAVLEAALKRHKTEILRVAPASVYTLEKILADTVKKILDEAQKERGS